VARFMGDNNIIRGTVTSRDGDRLVVEHGSVRASVRADDDGRVVGDAAVVSIRAAAVELDAGGHGKGALNSASCEIVFVEFLGDLVKLHLTAEGERMLAKVAGEEYPALRGREGEQITITWKEADVQLLRE
jgi:ABC-type Fe3+/spermidine/putrescine transport system ATPase subunit